MLLNPMNRLHHVRCLGVTQKQSRILFRVESETVCNSRSALCEHNSCSYLLPTFERMNQKNRARHHQWTLSSTVPWSRDVWWSVAVVCLEKADLGFAVDQAKTPSYKQRRPRISFHGPAPLTTPNNLRSGADLFAIGMFHCVHR